MQTVTEKYLFM